MGCYPSLSPQPKGQGLVRPWYASMAFHSDPHMAEMATYVYDVQTKVEDIVEGRKELKREVWHPEGTSLRKLLADRRENAILKQAVFDHLQVKTIPDQCRKEHKKMTAEETYAAAKAKIEALMVD